MKTNDIRDAVTRSDELSLLTDKERELLQVVERHVNQIERLLEMIEFRKHSLANTLLQGLLMTNQAEDDA